MWSRARIATTASAAAAIVVILTLLAVGGGGGGAVVARTTPEPPCGSATDAVVRATTLVVARRLRDEEHTGPTVRRARTSISSDAVLAAAVARGNARAARREALVLLFNHEHVVRLRVLRAGRVIADVGGRLVLTPVYATLRRHGRVVGTVEFSVQDDMGYRLLTQRLVGVRSVMRFDGATVMADIDVGSQPLPQAGTLTLGGVRYLVATIVTGHFPTGTLDITLLIPVPAAALARESCAQLRTDLLGDIARRVYEESIRGPAAIDARAVIEGSRVLPAALAAGHVAQATASARRLLRAGHLAGLAVLDRGGRTVADVGISAPALAPIVVVLHRHGADVGEALLAVQSANGFVGVASYLTHSDVLVRDGARQLAGRIWGPAALPASGPLRWHGGGYHVASFAATRFPSGAVTVYALVRDQP